jgi:choline-sulfatase
LDCRIGEEEKWDFRVILILFARTGSERSGKVALRRQWWRLTLITDKVGAVPDSPNVLFLIDDEHRPDVAGFAGDDVVRTPTLDWLAETGTVFENAYTPAPVCVPARHSLRTGQLPRTWARHGHEAFESGYQTLPRQFGEHGYMTASAGKMHYSGWAQMQGWRKRLGPTPMKRAIGDDTLDMQVDTDHGGLSDWKWSGPKEVKRAGVADSRVQVQDRRSVEGTEQFISQYFSAPYYDRCQPDRPLVLQTSLIQPHYPYFTDDEDLFTYYLNRVDPHVEQPEAFHPVISECRTRGECRLVRPGEDASEREIRRATAAYYAMVERVDAMFGRVIDALRHHGEDPDEWVIVFTSDHGEMLGERAVWGKGQFLESSARVPLVIRYPERFDPGTVTQNVNLCDLYATVCDLADLPVPDGLDSRSLVPLLAGDIDAWRERHGSETVSQDVGNSSVRHGVDTEHLMIKRDDLKYCYYGEDVPEVLFDLERDPDETTNFATDPEYADAMETFRERRGELGYGPNADPDYETAGYDPGVEP